MNGSSVAHEIVAKTPAGARRQIPDRVLHRRRHPRGGLSRRHGRTARPVGVCRRRRRPVGLFVGGNLEPASARRVRCPHRRRASDDLRLVCGHAALVSVRDPVRARLGNLHRRSQPQVRQHGVPSRARAARRHPVGRVRPRRPDDRRPVDPRVVGRHGLRHLGRLARVGGHGAADGHLAHHRRAQRRHIACRRRR